VEPTKRAYKAFRYKAKSTWSSARRGMLSAAGKPDIVVGSPPEFKGEPDIWAPEELLVGCESEASNHTPSLVDFTTTTPELKFSVLTPRSPQSSGCPLQQSLIRNEIRDRIPSTSER